MDDDAGTQDGAVGQAALEALVDNHRRFLRFVASRVSDPADAEEILQQTNLVLWRKFGRFEQGTDFDRWACRIAYYEVLKARENLLADHYHSGHTLFVFESIFS